MLQQQLAPFKVIVRPFKRLMQRKLDQRVCALGLTPITEFVEDDVLIAGYPKSGNTWFQNLITGVIYGIDADYASDALIQDLVPDVHYKSYYNRYGTPMFFKSHNLPQPENRRVVYLLRDGRDVMVSYFHYLTALNGKEINFLEMVQAGKGLYPCKWHEHVEAWLSNPYHVQMLIIRYEDLKINTVKELRRFCEFIGVERDDPLLESAAAKASFEKMRLREKTSGWSDSQWPKDKAFVRRGQVHSYKDEMPPHILETFLEDANVTLLKLGYI
jgi:hypothetical protein